MGRESWRIYKYAENKILEPKYEKQTGPIIEQKEERRLTKHDNDTDKVHSILNRQNFPFM